jgi:hypothetical protein
VSCRTTVVGAARRQDQTVEYVDVDGEGRIRRAAQDATDPVDREALWAFRGGGGVGVATRLEFELVAPPAVWAGYQLWHIGALEPVVTAWAAAMDGIGDELTTSISVLHTPPDGPFPPELRGVPIVHLAFASCAGEAAAAPLLNALRAVPRPVVDDGWDRLTRRGCHRRIALAGRFGCCVTLEK